MTKKLHSNQDIPVIIWHSQQALSKQRLTVDEFMHRTETLDTKEEFYFRLYRAALNYYGAEDYNKAEDLLIYLCETCDYERYEYCERLANIYRIQHRADKERCILLISRRKTTMTALHKRIDRRLTKIEAEFIPHSGIELG